MNIDFESTINSELDIRHKSKWSGLAGKFQASIVIVSDCCDEYYFKESTYRGADIDSCSWICGIDNLSY